MSETADPVEYSRIHAQLAQVVGTRLAAGFHGSRSGDGAAECGEEIAQGGKYSAVAHGLVLPVARHRAPVLFVWWLTYRGAQQALAGGLPHGGHAAEATLVVPGLVSDWTADLKRLPGSSYAIGVAQPLSIYVDLHGTGKVDEAKLEDALRTVMDLSPSGIRRHLDLNKPIYAKTSSYGHFGRKAGRDGSFSWEKTDLAKALKDAVAA